jgi:quinohemoprotein ethanol dehydrogenase
VLAGVGGSHGVHRDVLEWQNDGRILVWKLAGEATMPPVEPMVLDPIDPSLAVLTQLTLTQETVSRGRDSYSRHCARCHGITTRSTGIIPDLKRSRRGVHESWNEIVLGGILSGGGMAGFSDVITESDAADIHAYVVARALHEPTLVEELARWASKFACIPAEWAAD